MNNNNMHFIIMIILFQFYNSNFLNNGIISIFIWFKETFFIKQYHYFYIHT